MKNHNETLLPFEKRKTEILIARKSETSEKFGKNPKNSRVEELLDTGIVNIDKPKGPTSHQVSAYVQKILCIKKSGHSGTLDPGVTGVLPIALGKGTKILSSLLSAGKEYVCLMHVHQEIEEEKIRKAIEECVGKISQLPPKKSAIKRQWRTRKVYYMNILEIEGKDVLFKVGCEAGTYIRKLCHDIGKNLGTGAHMSELRRTKAGPFSENNSVNLHELVDAYYYWKAAGNEKYIRKCIFPVETGAAHLKKIWILDSAVDSLCHGADLNVPGISKVESGIELEETVAIFSLKEELVSIGNAKMNSEEMLGTKGLAVRTAKVFMLPGTYPKIVKPDVKT